MKGKGRGGGSGRGGRRRCKSRGAPADVASPYDWIVLGAKVEVRSDEEGFVGAWFAAEVVHLESRSSCVVEYEQLLADDASTPLQELVLFHNLRPCPPALPACHSWLQGHLVEAYDRDGWWAGIVERSFPDVDQVVVRFRTTGEELSFAPALIRGLQSWYDGEWTDLTQVGRPDNYQEVNAADANGSPSPSLSMTETRKRGCSPRREQLDADLPSLFQEEVDHTMETDSDSIPESPAKKLKPRKNVNGYQLCDADDLQGPRSNAYSSTLGEFASHIPELLKGKVRLELVAYKLLVEALRSKGPLKWEHEALLCDVRLHLNITSEEQVFVLKGFTPPKNGRH